VKNTLVFVLLSPLLWAAVCRGQIAAQEGDNVTFVVPINKTMFSPHAAIEVLLFSGDEIAAMEKQSSCVSGHRIGAQGDERICPPGVVYREVIPEKFLLRVSQIDSSISVPSGKIRINNKYKLSVRGKSSDNCNTTSAQQEGTAAGKNVVLAGLKWSRTEMACGHLPADHP
jgi:hypothetical protein